MAMEFRGEGGTKTVAIGKQVPRVENACRCCRVTVVKYQRGVLGEKYAFYTSFEGYRRSENGHCIPRDNSK